ncbi:hypothetical protein VKT23_010578 [Stygiomarasmius scandens]|uniref:C2H2-type domain-containing protein n=1 Tax=Marasmiellus scandens TaxID=2682957 RepID=A0ABR1JBK6_9AGAR
MAAFQCSSCPRKFNLSTGLANHRKQSKKCSAVKPKLKPRNDKVPQASGSADVTAVAIPSEPSGESSSMAVDEPEATPIVEPPPNALKPLRTGRVRFLPAHYVDQLPALSHDMPNTIPLPD